ncbi:MAG TPA: DUF4350 domain-containing protein [Acidimicrobiales bacterium]
MSAATGAGRAGAARPWTAVAGAVAVVLVTLGAILAIGSGGGDRPLDPTSHDRLGTSALVSLLDEMGADVTIAARPPGDEAGGPDVVLLLTDLLGDDARRGLDGWIDRGGRLVVTDPGSGYAPEVVGWFGSAGDLAPPRSLAGRCEIVALAGLDLASIEPRNGGALFAPRPGDAACVDDGSGGAYVVADDRGQGTVVALGGSGLIVNAALAQGENAPVTTALLAPRAGTEVLVVAPGGPVGGGRERSLSDLVPAGVLRAIAQLAVAFTVYALWRARRLGRPVPESQPVAVAGSDLVAAVGTLLDRTRTPAHAGELLRADLRRFLADRLGVPAAAPPDVMAAVAAQRIATDEARLHWALGGAPVSDDAGLADLAATIDRIREEVLTHV